MPHKKSANSVKKNSSVWSKNVTAFNLAVKRRKKIPVINHSLVNMCRIPKEAVVIGRFNGLAEDMKNRKSRFQLVAQELVQLWQKLNFPTIAMTSVERKIEKLIARHVKFLKRPLDKVEEEFFSHIFDITSPDGEWLSAEDREMHHKQVATQGRVGYVTGKLIPIHPSKVKKCPNENAVDAAVAPQCLESIDEISRSTSTNISSTDDSHDDDYQPPKCPSTSQFSRRQRHVTTHAMSLVKQTNLSTRKAATVCQELSHSGIQLPTPSQSGVYKASFREAEQMKLRMKETLKTEEWALHFDGKHLHGKERQVIVLKNSTKEIRLGVLSCDNSRAATIANGIKETVTYFELWPAIKMIICDTTAVNTGKKNGIVKILQRHFVSLNLPAPQYVGCQHHILDRILKHVMDELFGSDTRSANLHYDFVNEIVENYDRLKNTFIQRENGNEKLNVASIGWRDDMQFLLELGYAFRHYRDNRVFPLIEFKTLPHLSNARWNSRGIFGLLAFFLLPNRRQEMTRVCEFITGVWMDVWFSNHMFSPDAYGKLEEAVRDYGKAKTCLRNHWCEEPSVINTQRSNICAERCIQFLQTIRCMRDDTLNWRFIFSNKDV
jgi:hypothetical protein